MLALGNSAALRAPERPITPWSDGAKGAVSITYDDGLDSQLDVAVPALDAAA